VLASDDQTKAPGTTVTGRPGAADAADDFAGAAVPPRDYGPDGSAGWLFWSAPRQADDTTTRPSESGLTSQSNARNFGPSFYTPIDRQGSGRVAK
jgi:hypothetical protein